ncbi:MAG: CBS domain-containing protein [Polyangia bacterium]
MANLTRPVAQKEPGRRLRPQRRPEILLHRLHRGSPFLRSFHLAAEKTERKEVPMLVKQIMSQPVATCTKDSSLNEAAQLMWDYDCGVLPVVDGEGRAVAMLTDRDVCMAAYTQGRPLAEIRVGAAMSKDLFSCGPEDALTDAERILQERQIRRIPVLDADRRPVGMLSLNDLARMAMQQHPAAPGMLDGVSSSSVARTLAAVCSPRRAAMQGS